MPEEGTHSPAKMMPATKGMSDECSGFFPEGTRVTGKGGLENSGHRSATVGSTVREDDVYSTETCDELNSDGTGGSHFERMSSIVERFANKRPRHLGFVSKSSLYHLKSYLVGVSILVGLGGVGQV